MQRITIEIEQSSDIQLLLLAKRIGLKVILPSAPKFEYNERQKHLQIIAKGGDVSYIENPIDWQKEQRKDRDLPFRH